MIQRTDDGSILFDFSTEYNVNARCNPLEEKCQQPNQPPYNDAYMKRVREIAATEFQGTTALDPIQDCRASGVPRAGAPQFVIQSPQVIAFLYDAAPYSTYRMIYLDGRPHPDMKTYETTYFGDSIGHWEGDTLRRRSIGFNDDTWLGGGGAGGNVQFTSVHSEKEHAVERLTRDGDTLIYDVTVEDPDALTKPWVLATRHIRHAVSGHEVPGEDALTKTSARPPGISYCPALRIKT